MAILSARPSYGGRLFDGVCSLYEIITESLNPVREVYLGSLVGLTGSSTQQLPHSSALLDLQRFFEVYYLNQVSVFLQGAEHTLISLS